ncbi:MAG: hypothetical protein AAB590_03760 [Patescibacteria group bacterium]
MEQNIAKPIQKSWFLKWILALGIVIVMNLLFNYGLRTFYKPTPMWDDFCKIEQVNKIPETQEECVSAGGAWNTNPNYDKTIPAYSPEIRVGVDQTKGYCDVNYTCQREYESATKIYNRNAFIVLVVLGIIAIIASFKFIATEAVSLGLSLGGVISMIVGAIRYWSNMDDKLRFGVLLIGFIALIWLGIKKIRD